MNGGVITLIGREKPLKERPVWTSAQITAPRLALAYGLDILFGDPQWFPHPVRGFGFLIKLGERWLRKPSAGPGRQFFAGGVLTVSVTSIAWMLGRSNNATVQVILAWTALATRSLLDEASSVIDALEAGDLESARQRVARIVGRDTQHLDQSEISRALIETLAESACDGIVAPLFWLAICGVPAAMAYKAVNTLDSMIGHRDASYLYFGRFAARLDDGVNYLPARLTAMGIIAAAKFHGLNADRAFEIWRRDGDKHTSPNAGQSESAMAGALDVRLGGQNFYGGEPHHGPVFHAPGAMPSIHHAKVAISIVAVVSGLAFGLALLLVSGRRRV